MEGIILTVKVHFPPFLSVVRVNYFVKIIKKKRDNPFSFPSDVIVRIYLL